MATQIKVTESKMTTTTAEPNEHVGGLSPERVEELRKRVEQSTESYAHSGITGVAIRIKSYVLALDDWLGGPPTSQLGRNQIELETTRYRSVRNLYM